MTARESAPPEARAHLLVRPQYRPVLSWAIWCGTLTGRRRTRLQTAAAHLGGQGRPRLKVMFCRGLHASLVTTLHVISRDFVPPSFPWGSHPTHLPGRSGPRPQRRRPAQRPTPAHTGTCARGCKFSWVKRRRTKPSMFASGHCLAKPTLSNTLTRSATESRDPRPVHPMKPAATEQRRPGAGGVSCRWEEGVRSTDASRRVRPFPFP